MALPPSADAIRSRFFHAADLSETRQLTGKNQLCFLTKTLLLPPIDDIPCRIKKAAGAEAHMVVKVAFGQTHRE